ncbi:uncharacterized protein LAESUDRAFT_665794 [Laetiporus sulphureus 93-53]|uniref:Uncharacterized protein n=1 Tax=Laetiporus sulphureus 93-53 TaxID=1314785 RepID=A0A165B9X1_9APHY|nr:uncharacterized protein LAESUDRAFT_665794 [Laetiporus sulphureus 93-53]KZT00586.1 hypothetical protein LAESUDRAFT_665794 [Laetiporus sulphureus 93-53]
MQKYAQRHLVRHTIIVPFGVTYEKIGTIQRRLAWPLHKDDTLSRSGRPTGLNIYFLSFSFLLRSCLNRLQALPSYLSSGTRKLSTTNAL